MDNVKPVEVIQALDVFLKNLQDSPLLAFVAGGLILMALKFLYDKFVTGTTRRDIEDTVNATNRVILNSTKDLSERLHAMSANYMTAVTEIVDLKKKIGELEDKISDYIRTIEELKRNIKKEEENG